MLAGPRARKGWADRGAGRDGAGPSAGRDWAGGFGLEKGKLAMGHFGFCWANWVEVVLGLFSISNLFYS